MAEYKYPSVSYEIAEKITKKSGMEVRVTVPGHTQRGGSPDSYDRVFASRLGAEAARLILLGEYGYMVGYKNREIVKVPLEDVAGKLKMVDPNSTIINEAKTLGISFGD
jgi:6-phosphofructokinase 1